MVQQLYPGIEVIEGVDDHWQVLLIGKDNRYHRVSATNKQIRYPEAEALATYWQQVLGCSVVYRPNSQKIIDHIGCCITQCPGIT